MSYLEVIKEEKVKKFEYPRSATSRYPNIIIHTDKDTLSPFLGVPPPKDFGKNSESFVTDSYDSSFDSPLDSEVQSIKSITSALHSGLKQQLKSYKGLSSKYSSQNQQLKTRLEEYKQEIEEVKVSVTEMVAETTHTHEYVKKLRESSSNRESRLCSEEGFTSNSMAEVNLVEIIKKLSQDIEDMKVRAELTQSQLVKEEVKPLVIEDTQKTSSCKCIIV